jgi:hypothetical protein
MDIKLETIFRERIANRENARQLAEAYAPMVVEENTILRHCYSSINPVLPTQELPRIKREVQDSVAMDGARHKTMTQLLLYQKAAKAIKQMTDANGMDWKAVTPKYRVIHMSHFNKPLTLDAEITIFGQCFL